MSAVPAGRAVMTIAALTGKRFLRSRILLIAAVFAFLPLLPFVLGAGSEDAVETRWRSYIGIVSYVQLLVASLLMAPALAEEIEDKTYAYLWSRPIPRWSVLAGKLLTGSIIGIALFVLSVLAAKSIIGRGEDMAAKAILGLSSGVIAVGCIASCFGTLVPKYPLAFSISYFLVLDFGIGAMPFSGARISVMHNVIALSGLGDHKNSFVTSLLWLLGLSAFWLGIALWRLGKKELSTGS